MLPFVPRAAWCAVLFVLLSCGCGGDSPAIDIEFAGLEGRVLAFFDEHGFLHAQCQTDDDCAAALGYFHARDRWIQMEFRRRFARGTLTEIVSPLVRDLVADFSFTNRLVFSTRDGTRLEEAVFAGASAKTRALFEAYSVGVNAWIGDVLAGRNGAELPEEYESFIFELGDPPSLAEWTPEDSIASILALIEALTNRSEEELALGAIAAQTKEDTFLDLYGLKPGTKEAILDDYVGPPLPSSLTAKKKLGPQARPPRASFQVFTSALSRLRRRPGYARAVRRSMPGSNNWAIGPDKSASGNALLSNDPHLPMSNPPLWYVAHLDAKTQGTGDMHLAGVTFAGVPFVILGQSEHLAWGATTANMDLVDVYEETLSEDGMGVRFNDQDVPFINKDVTLNFADDTTETRTLRWVPHHGPVLAIDQDENTAISIRWTGQDVTTDVDTITELMTATTVEEARTVLRNVTSIGQNWVIADTQGSIGWFPYNTVPIRPWGSTYRPWTPVPGDGSAEWAGFLAYEDLPQQFNPGQGFIATANNDMTGHLADGNPGNEPYTALQSFAAPGFRFARIVDLLEARDDHSVETMDEVQGDTFSLVGEQMAPALLTVAADLDGVLSDAAEQVVDVLSAWAFTCPTGLDGTDPDLSPLSTDAVELREAAGCTAFHVLLRELELALINDEVAEFALVMDDDRPDFRADLQPSIEATIFSVVAPDELAAGDVYWDDVSTEGEEVKEDIVAAVLDTTGQILNARLGSDPSSWAWGRVHALILRSDLDTATGGLILDYNHPRVANDGALFTVDVADPNDDLNHDYGPSMRLICEVFPDRPSCSIQLPGGQVGFTTSPHYDDLLDEFLANEPVPLRFDIKEVANDAESLIVLGPPG